MEEKFQTFTVQISKLARMVKKIKSEEMAEFDLKGPNVSCLYYLLKCNGALTAKELTEICDEDKAAISRSLDFLEKEGYIFCESKFEKRYKSPLMLTDKGREVAVKLAEKIDKIVDFASAELDPNERLVMYKCLGIISGNLQKLCDKYGEE